MIHFIYKNKLKSINCLNVSDTRLAKMQLGMSDW